MVATELLTNATRAAGAVVRLSVDVHRAWIEVSVTDDGPGRPQQRDATILDATGRGLSIIDALASEWGVRTGVGPGPLKSVWVRIAVAEDAGRGPLCTQ